MENRIQPILQLVAARPLGCDFQSTPNRDGRRRRHDRRFDCSSPPGRCGRKRGIISNGLGRSRGGFSTKVHALVDTKGRPLHVQITPGQQHESTVAETIIENFARGRAFVADTGYDSEAIRKRLKSMRIKAVIHPHPNRKKKPRLDRQQYSQRYRVEVCFHDLKRFRAIATRFEKTARNYLALIQLACSMLWLQDVLEGA